MGVPGSNIQDLERQRLELENNILQLQRSLYHWRTWEAEYDGLKEEIGELDDAATPEDFLQVSRDFGGTLVNEEELRNNVATIEKRLHAAENQLNVLDSVEQVPGEPTADFPMKEIIEELDENGDVISGTTAAPGDQASDLLELLNQAGVKDIPEFSKTDTPAASTGPLPESFANDNFVPKDEPQGHDSATADVSAPAEVNGLQTPRSSAESDKEVPIVDVIEPPEDARLRREMLRYGLDEVGAVVAELELDDDASEISIDEEYDSYAEDDDEEEEDEFGRSVRPVLDDDYHRQMRELEAKLNARGMWNVGKDIGTLPEDVKEELEQPLKIKIEKEPGSNEGPVAERKPKKKVAFADDLDIAPAPRPLVKENKTIAPRQSDIPVLSDSIVERTEPAEKSVATNGPSKKVSRFKTARNTDNPAEKSASFSGNSRPVELRSSQSKPTTSSPSTPLPLFPARPAEPKPFSQPISDITEQSPAGPQTGKILADTLVERDTSEGTAMPPEPDELDEQLHRKEIATEFYRMRNRMIKQNGGFVDNEPETVPVDPEETPRVSKFRAARMR
ncbi:hypothetical protein AOCH_000613 [Aspergillus ochraceoroseus]|uniref:DUF3835 domain-containing protein n=1 Tax=Aspergillus ochraceoroseus TaxID=138278 RepID=A0A0F8X6T1_9EURO|nr:hypothetical protein AOCH_000613 [Aspergillus ochraceoroseus]